MKCTSCGLPLSPSRSNTHCPRCGTPTASGYKSKASSAQQHYKQANWGSVNRYSLGERVLGGVQPAIGTDSDPLTWSREPAGPWQEGQAIPLQGTYSTAPSGLVQMSPVPPSPSNIPQQVPFMQPGQIRLPGIQSPEVSPQQVPLPHGKPLPATYRQSPRKNSLGLLVAALCVFTGGFILILVFFLARSLPGTVGNTNTRNTTSFQTAPNGSASPVSITPSPIATTLPGSHYIDGASMANTVDTKSAKATSLATTFKVHSTMYVTFTVHPNGQNGAVCLLWYLNGQEVTHYNFAVSKSSAGSRYSYAIYGETGPAYVELYWASNTSCSNKMLAQHVDFTVIS